MEIAWQLFKAFAVGGGICMACQIVQDLTNLTPGRILVGLVVVGVLLGAAGVYAPLVEWAGAGATVPLCGFGYTMVKGVREAVASDGWRGVLTGAWTAGAGGVTAAVLCGLAAALLAKPKEK